MISPSLYPLSKTGFVTQTRILLVQITVIPGIYADPASTQGFSLIFSIS